MALGRTYSVALVGLNGYIVEVEADIGQPMSNKRHMIELFPLLEEVACSHGG